MVSVNGEFRYCHSMIKSSRWVCLAWSIRGFSDGRKKVGWKRTLTNKANLFSGSFLIGIDGRQTSQTKKKKKKRKRNKIKYKRYNPVVVCCFLKWYALDSEVGKTLNKWLYANFRKDFRDCRGRMDRMVLSYVIEPFSWFLIDLRSLNRSDLLLCSWWVTANGLNGLCIGYLIDFDELINDWDISVIKLIWTYLELIKRDVDLGVFSIHFSSDDSILDILRKDVINTIVFYSFQELEDFWSYCELVYSLLC